MHEGRAKPERALRWTLTWAFAATLSLCGLACDGAPREPVASEPVASAPAPVGDLADEELSKLEALGYLSGYVEPPPRAKVTVHDRARAYEGLNFYCSAHRPSCSLVDMEGRVLHEWQRAIEEIWPEKSFDGVQHTTFWRRAYPYPNGDLLAIFENIGIVKLDRDSNVLWKRDNRAHHDLAVLANGDIWVLTSQLRSIPEYAAEVPVQEDFLTLLDRDGETKREISLLASIERSRYRDTLAGPMRSGLRPDAPVYDIFHTNTLEVLDGRAEAIRPEFARGNILTSFRSLNLICVIDPASGSTVWAYRGRFKRQHDPKIIDGGHLLLFDNSGGGKESAVLEYDLASMDIVWSYAGTEESPFFSVGSGASQRLPNGNTLITETMRGRVFEVTREGEIVWEFLNPHRVGEGEGLIAGIWEMIRLDGTAPPEWARAASAPDGSGTEIE